MSDSRRTYRSGMVSDDLVKRLWKGIADTEQQQDAADRIEKLEAKLAKAVEALHWIGTRSIMIEAGADSLRLHARMTLAELKGTNQ